MTKLWLIAFVPALIWMFRRGTQAQRVAGTKGLDENADFLPQAEPYEEIERQEGGLSYGRKAEFDKVLSAQDKLADDPGKIIPGATSQL
ncbi:hypothetical protein ACFFF7_01685 [Novosphingobium aquiterrae]|uniref:Uncharacterized protein n=1 Tax=Novosphingobium aquiterrae TaxID=624388 RepID=A0ABV6PFH1_9SPHN